MLALLTLLTLLASCKKQKEDDTSDGTDTEAVTGIAAFMLIRAEMADETVIDALDTLRDKINEVCSVQMRATTDRIEDGEEIPVDSKEILVGDTNRRKADGLKSEDFQIKREGSKIYLLGGSSDAVAAAVEYFAANYINADGLVIEDGTDHVHRGNYDLNEVYFGATKIEKIKYYGLLINKNNKLVENELINAVEGAVHYELERVATPEAANLILDEKSTDKLAAGQWGVITEDGKVTIVGGGSNGRIQAMAYVADKFKMAENTIRFEVGTHSEKIVTKEEYLSGSILDIYPEFSEKINRDYTYSVSVTQGAKTATIPVYDQTAAMPQTVNYDEADTERRFSTFAFCGERVRVDIKVKQDFTSYSVMPSEKNFEHSFDAQKGIISVYLDKPEYFLIRLDNKDSTVISVFADTPEFPYEEYKYSSNTIFIKDWHETKSGYLDIALPNTVVYIAPGAVLNARLNVSGKGSKVYGHGAILDPFSNIFKYDITTSKDNWIVRLEADNLIFDGPHILDARGFNIATNKNNAIIKNAKILSSVISSDGIGITSERETGTLIEHCYVYCGDNAIVFSAKDFICRDITIGTTCSAIYAQGSPVGTFEDIHVFRSDAPEGGLVRNLYNVNSNQQTMDIKINNLYGIDCPRLGKFFFGAKMGTKEKKFTFNNVYLTVTDPSKPYVGVSHKADGELITGNYKLNIKNLSVNGNVISAWKSEYSEYASGSENNSVICTSESGFKPVEHDSNVVNYKAEHKVFVGTWQVMFENDVVLASDVFLLPYEQLKAELLTSADAQTVERDGVMYVRSDKLVEFGMASKVEIRDGALYIIPNTPDNMFTPDNGEVSKYMESWASNSDLKAKREGDKEIYRISGSGNYAIVRSVNEEIFKFGAGEYKLTFTLKAPSMGQVRVSNTLGVDNNAENAGATFIANTAAKTYVFKFKITDEQMTDEQMAIKFALSGTNKIAYFEVSDISLTRA